MKDSTGAFLHSWHRIIPAFFVYFSTECSSTDIIRRIRYSHINIILRSVICLGMSLISLLSPSKSSFRLGDQVIEPLFSLIHFLVWVILQPWLHVYVVNESLVSPFYLNPVLIIYALCIIHIKTKLFLLHQICLFGTKTVDFDAFFTFLHLDCQFRIMNWRRLGEILDHSHVSLLHRQIICLNSWYFCIVNLTIRRQTQSLPKKITPKQIKVLIQPFILLFDPILFICWFFHAYLDVV